MGMENANPVPQKRKRAKRKTASAAIKNQRREKRQKAESHALGLLFTAPLPKFNNDNSLIVDGGKIVLAQCDRCMVEFCELSRLKYVIL